MARVDKTLRLDERTLTAWELLERNETRAAALMGFERGGERNSRTFNPRTLLRRSWSWQAYCALPLLLVWLGLVWLDVGLRFDSAFELSAPKTLAQKLREFSRDLQEKAKNEGLQESLRVGRELEQVAQQSIDGENRRRKIQNRTGRDEKPGRNDGKIRRSSLSGRWEPARSQGSEGRIGSAREIS